VRNEPFRRRDYYARAYVRDGKRICQMPENTRPNTNATCLSLIDERDRDERDTHLHLACTRARAKVSKVKGEKFESATFPAL
jgi:topoisomerase IA-like protein